MGHFSPFLLLTIYQGKEYKDKHKNKNYRDTVKPKNIAEEDLRTEESLFSAH